MAITTLVPFIKSGIPRLSDFEVRKAKLIQMDLKKANYNSKLFQQNHELIRQIYDSHMEMKNSSPAKNIPNADVQNPYLNNKENILIDDKKESFNSRMNAELTFDSKYKT